MKKVITISLLLIFVLAGCAGQGNNEQTDANQDNDGKKLREKRMPDFERPESKPSVTGLVKSILGNEVTILKIDRSDREGKDSVEGMTDMTDEQKAEKKASLNPSMAMGGGGGGMRMGKGSNSSGDKTDMVEIMKKLSTGEAIVTIPVGIKMLKKDNMEMVEATLEDIKKDTMLIVWTDETITDRNIANFVILN